MIKLLVIDSTGSHAHRYQLRQSKKPENVDTLIVGSSVCLCSFVSCVFGKSLHGFKTFKLFRRNGG